MDTIANMSLEELRKFVEDTIDARLTSILGRFDGPAYVEEDDGLPWDEIRATVEQSRWTPPPGSKSSLELLREDREN